MTIPKGIVDDNRHPVSLLKLLGRGGEGAVYEILGDPTKAAKIYFPEKARSRRDKVLAMVRAKLQDGATSVAFPTKPLFHSNGEFAGFTMDKVRGRSPVHELYSPSSRRTKFVKANFPFLIRSAINLSNAVGAVHAKGCVIGDINHSGILISDDARTTLIDADSFQFSLHNDLFRCIVATEDFTPPELQGRRPDEVVRTINHDSFGLGVIIFMLLFMGRHPFIGDYLGTGSLPFEKAIREYRFAFSADRKRTGMEPPPHLPILSDLPTNLGNAFEAAFGPGSPAGGRPTASDWVRLLKEAEAELIPCRQSPAHHYFKAARTCPWCRMERGFPGFVAFTSPVHVNGSTPTDLTQLISAIRAVSDPGIAAPLLSVMPAVQAVAKQPAPSTNDTTGLFAAATLGALISIPLFTTQTIHPLLAICGFAGSAYLALRSPAASQAKHSESDLLRKGFDFHGERYRAVVDNRRFLETRRDTEREIAELGGLGGEEARQIANLSQRLRESQLHHFLDRFQIASAKIKGLGRTRKATLRSYGIETAADVDRARIEAISGFGPATSALLLSWRSSLERRFVFNPNQPINPADIAQIKTSIARKRAQLEQALFARLTELRTISAEIVQSRKTILNQATNVWRDLKQAEADERTTPVLANLSGRRWLFGALTVSTLILSNSLTSKTAIPPPRQTQYSIPAPVAPMAAVNAPAPMSPKQTGTPLKRTGAPIDSNLTAKPSPNSPPSTDPLRPGPASSPSLNSDAPALVGSLPAPPSLKPQQGLPFVTGTIQASPTWPPIADVKPDAAGANPLPPPLSLSATDQLASSSPNYAAPPNESSTNFDTFSVASKLNELGYLEFAMNGDTAQIKRAIRDLKIINGLPSNDTIDDATAKLLSSRSSLPAKQSFLGGWSTDQACSDGARLEISTAGANVEAGSCKFSRISLGVGTWKVQARCQVGVDAWPANIIFKVQGRRLEWSSEKGRQYYYRCR